MKRVTTAVAVAAFAAGCQPPTFLAPPAASSGPHEANQVLVRFEPETPDATREALRAKYAATQVETLPSGTERWFVSGAPREVAATLSRETGVKAAHPNWVRQIQAFVPQDQDYTNGNQWHLRSEHLNMEAIWNHSGYGTLSVTGKDVIVAVVDSGVDMTHPDLVDNIAKTATGSLAFIDLVNDPFKAPKLDGHGHGTHVAGIIAAKTDGTEKGEGTNRGNVLGVAPEAKILPVQVMNQNGGGDDFKIAKGIEEAVKWRGQNGAKVDVINLSIGGADPSPTLAASLAFAAKHGVLVIAAAGNYNAPVYYPAAYPGALAVGALTPHGKRASYSCYGPELAIMAPGGAEPKTDEALGSYSGIYSTFPTYYTTTGKLWYGAQAGTSMAAPVVTGVAALILAQAKARGQTLTPDQLRMRLVATADDIGDPGFDSLTGWGKLNPKRALDWTSHNGGTP